MRSEAERRQIFRCKKCSKQLAYIVAYDAYACYWCNEWTEKNCGSPRCDFCHIRPEKPRKVLDDKV